MHREHGRHRSWALGARFCNLFPGCCSVLAEKSNARAHSRSCSGRPREGRVPWHTRRVRTWCWEGKGQQTLLRLLLRWGTALAQSHTGTEPARGDSALLNHNFHQSQHRCQHRSTRSSETLLRRVCSAGH